MYQKNTAPFSRELMSLYKFHGIRDIELTQRENECAQYIVKGLSAKEIAIHLNISNRTVETYIRSLKTKLVCRNRLQLIAKLLIAYYGFCVI